MVGLLLSVSTWGTAIVGPWEPMFKGVDHSVSTNLPGVSGMPHRLVIHTIRVDLSDPDIQLLSTPPIDNPVQGTREVGGLTVSDFLRTNQVQVAINANLFDAREYYLPAGIPMDVYGLAVSEGRVVSKQESSENSTVILLDRNNRASFVSENWPSVDVSDVYTAVAGTYPILVGGVDVARGYQTAAGFIHNPNPRTVFGLSEDRRYLFLMTIDGRQPGYSEGALDYEAAEWLLLMGAHDGVNMDGGGSTTLVMQDSTGQPVRLNRSSAVADSGKERTVGSHLGIRAKPLPGFVNDLAVEADDTTARVSWTSVEAATSQVEYGLGVEVNLATELNPVLAKEHTVRLTGLAPNTGYYFRAVSTSGGVRYASTVRFFTTIHHATTNRVFEVTQPWHYTKENPNDALWTQAGYDDASWSGPGEGLFWVDVRATGPNPDVLQRATNMPSDPSNSGFPYRTYYFRTHFQGPTSVAGVSMILSGYVDDGAVVYLNGSEIYRLRMPEGTIRNDTLASGFPCSGDATCLDQFEIPISALSGLVSGDNVLAVEVHNYNARSADITVGLALDLVEPIVRRPTLNIELSGGGLKLVWEGTGYALQSAEDPVGPWVDVAGTVQSPYAIAGTGARRYFRLRR